MEPYTPEKLPPKGIDWEQHVPLIGSANRALARCDGVLLGIINPQILLSPLATHEAVLSSRIEGTQASLEDVLEYEGGMQLESILIHEFAHVIHGVGFDEALQQRLTDTFMRARAKGIWNDGRAAQRFRRVKSKTPVLLLNALAE